MDKCCDNCVYVDFSCDRSPCRDCESFDKFEPYKQTKGEDKVKDDNLYLIPFYEEWNGDTDSCYILEGRDALDNCVNDEYKDELGKTFQVYKLVPAFKVKLGLSVEILDEQYFF